MSAAIVVFVAVAPAASHEFWLEPSTYTPNAGDKIPISIRIGQNFKGNSYPYLREDFKVFTLTDGRGTRPVRGIDGDDPAVTATFEQPGLYIMVHYSTPEHLTFETWAKFDSYLKLEGLSDVAERHRRRGLPENGIVELYSRCAKLLVGVGDGRGDDRLTGMPLELVVEKNPYLLAPGEPVPVRLYHEGKPAADVQIAAISRAEPDNRLTARTDTEGRARLALPKSGPWLLNAVVMKEPKRSEKANWTSLWASMTFARP